MEDSKKLDINNRETPDCAEDVKKFQDEEVAEVVGGHWHGYHIHVQTERNM